MDRTSLYFNIVETLDNNNYYIITCYTYIIIYFYDRYIFFYFDIIYIIMYTEIAGCTSPYGKQLIFGNGQ